MNNYFRKITALLTRGKQALLGIEFLNQKNAPLFTFYLPKKFAKSINKRYFAIYLRNFLFLFFVLLAGVLLQMLVYFNNRYESARNAFVEKNNDYYYWNSIVSQFPNVPDILYNASLSSLIVGKKEEALVFINKALAIDPLFEKAYLLQSEILSR